MTKMNDECAATLNADNNSIVLEPPTIRNATAAISIRKMSTNSIITMTATCCLLASTQPKPSSAFPLASTLKCNSAFLRPMSFPLRSRSTCDSLNLIRSRRCNSSQLSYTSDNNNNGNGSTSEQQQPEDDDLDFVDLDEADRLFFNSMIRKNDDGHIDSDNAEELMQMLQEMIDSNNVALMDDGDFAEMDEETLMEILGYDDSDGDEYDHKEDSDYAINDTVKRSVILNDVNEPKQPTKGASMRGMRDLELALMQGVVPADAGVGSGILPGDVGFDPLELSTKDYFQQVQTFILNLLPERKLKVDDESNKEENFGGAALPIQGFVGEERPPALILRDYREAEIRHGRLAMLAAAIWPLQEILDRIFMPETFGDFTVVYGGTTLPFLPLLMTFMMLNLGYLDIYSSEIKENESGDAFLPGECFWDPLCMLEGAPDQMKRNMQEREILNGRAAMIAVAAFIFEEAVSHKPVITVGTNDLLFEPVYQVPFIQAWLDQQFGSVGETIMMQ